MFLSKCGKQENVKISCGANGETGRGGEVGGLPSASSARALAFKWYPQETIKDYLFSCLIVFRVIQHYRKLKCTKCDTKPDDPAVCMVCGKFVCLQGLCCLSTEDGRKHECVKVNGILR